MAVTRIAMTVTSELADLPAIRRFVVLSGTALATSFDPDVAALVASEVAANAIGLDAGEVTITVTPQGRRLRVEVRDHGYGMPEVNQPGRLDNFNDTAGVNGTDGDPFAHHWGLVIVDQLADRWGVEQFLPGKIVWFELPERRRADSSVATS